jgi:hypothetical protein
MSRQRRAKNRIGPTMPAMASAVPAVALDTPPVAGEPASPHLELVRSEPPSAGWQGDGGRPPPRPPVSGLELIRRALLLIMPIFICTFIAWSGAQRLQTFYAAQADIAFDIGQRADVMEKFLATQSVTVRSHAVLGSVSATQGIPVATLDRRLSTDFPKGGAIMRLQYSDPSGDVALQTLRAVIAQYINLLDHMKFLDSAKFVLVPPFILEDPVWPKPLQGAALGLALGLAIGIGALALDLRLRARA